MTNEFPVTPFSGNNSLPVPDMGDDSARLDVARMRENIRKLTEQRMREGTNPDDAGSKNEELMLLLNGVLREEKDLRIQKVRMNAERERLKAKILELRRDKLRKSELTASHQVRNARLKEEIRSGGANETERLELRIEDLRADLDAFRETLKMHRRDRDRVFDLVVQAQSHLQDVLTENVLWSIVELENDEPDKEIGTGLAGLASELLGRILVLEKMESRLSGLLKEDN